MIIRPAGNKKSTLGELPSRLSARTMAASNVSNSGVNSTDRYPVQTTQMSQLDSISKQSSKSTSIQKLPEISLKQKL
jgi:hypothetical protein